MEKRMITIHNMQTGEEITREMTQEEIDAQNAPGEFDAEIAAAAAEKEALRLSALNKLQDLGLTEDEAKAFLG